MAKFMSYKDFELACNRADLAMKQNNGHQFVQILKTRCQVCGRSPKSKGRCRGWFASFLRNLAHELTDVYGVPQLLAPEPSQPEGK